MQGIRNEIRNNLILSTSTIKGTTVKNAAGEKLGEIKDIMLDTESGKVVYAVLSVDTGFLNLDSKYFAIPWAALEFDTAQEDVVIFNVNKERLKNSPGFDKDNWPTAPQTEFINEVHVYYGYDPYYL
jgi:sporulation protein YlmC with PRC-barrel domain